MADFKGLDSNFYTGVVEDRHDPLYLGRVRVRVYGLHTDDKTMIPTPDLPWSDVLMPVTNSALSGLGLSPHGLVEGSTVMGFFRDERDMQDFVVMGSLFGRPSDFYKIPNNDPSKKISRSADEGFNDPRRGTRSEYDSSIDKPQIGRNFTLIGALDTAPLGRPSLEAKIDGMGTIITSVDQGVRYPRDIYTKDQLSDVNQGAIVGTGDTYPNSHITKHEGTSVKEPTRESVSPSYPFNKMIETEGGHVLELDDTPNAERIHLYHRTGSRIEMLRDGDVTFKVANNNYEIILKDKKVLIAGSADIELSNGNYNINAYKGKSEDGGSIKFTAHGGNIDLTTTNPDKAIRIKGKVSLNGTAFD